MCFGLFFTSEVSLSASQAGCLNEERVEELKLKSGYLSLADL